MEQADAYMYRIGQVHGLPGHTVQAFEQLLPCGGGKAAVNFPGKGDGGIAQGIVGRIYNQDCLRSQALLDMPGKIRGNGDGCQYGADHGQNDYLRILAYYLS